MDPIDYEPTYLYRAYDGEGALLYIGITCKPDGRLANHKHKSSWFGDAKRMSWALHPDRPSALEAEREAIESEQPRDNLNYQHPQQRAEAARRRDARREAERLAKRERRHALDQNCQMWDCAPCSAAREADKTKVTSGGWVAPA